MKKSLSFLLFFVSAFLYAGAQPVTVELSVCWKKSPDYLSPGKKSIQPYLNISYRNLSRKPVYLLKVTNDRHGFPKMVGGMALLNIDPQYRYKKLPAIDNYSHKAFIINISDIKDIDNHWFLEDPVNLENLDSTENIKFTLKEIYEYIIRKNYPENIFDNYYDHIDWRSTVLTSDLIRQKIADWFVFLMPGEVVTDSFNLIAFQMTGGRFTFCIEAKELPNSIELSADWRIEEGKSIQPERKLPERVGKFRLYSGTFLTNEVTVYFPGNKTN